MRIRFGGGREAPVSVRRGERALSLRKGRFPAFLFTVFLLVKSFGLWIYLMAGPLSPANGEETPWHPFSLSGDQAPVNLSFLLDAPAGQHGFLGIKDQRLVFEDGTEARFWGTALIGSACFPSPEQAPVTAGRLARFGVNLVRLHHLDADWAEPNLFADSDQPAFFNPEALDRLDYFLYQLENRGIYVWLGGLSSRRLKERDAVPAWPYLPAGLKGYIYFAPELQNLHQRYLEALWTHRNRYTGLEYRDSPSIVLTDLFHDNNLQIDLPRLQPYEALFEGLWRGWLQFRKIEPPVPFDSGSPTPEMRRFIAVTMGRAHVEFHNFLREISVKIPIAGTGAVLSLRDLPPLEPMDFVQAGGLWNPPQQGLQVYSNRRMADVDPNQEANLFSLLAFARLQKKPFVVSMWGCPWPSPFRAELPLWMAAMACWQDWQGCVSSPYAAQIDEGTGGIPGPMEIHDDPAAWGLMPAAALLFHRRSLEAARPEVFMAVPESLLLAEDPVTPALCRTTRLTDAARVAVRLRAQPSGPSILPPTQPADLASFQIKTERRGGLRHDVQRGLVFVDTPHTQAVIGRLREAAADEPGLLHIQSGEDFGVVCVSSLDGQPIPKSRDLWITVISQAQNQDFRSTPAGEGFRIDAPGHSPVLIQDTPARLFIETRQTGWTLRTVDGGGREGAPLPYQIENNRISFRAGVHGSLYYRLSCSPASAE